MRGSRLFSKNTLKCSKYYPGLIFKFFENPKRFMGLSLVRRQQLSRSRDLLFIEASHTTSWDLANEINFKKSKNI